MKQGSIILVPFPYTDLSAIKTRPALVISRNSRSQDVIILAITSQYRTAAIQIDNDSLTQGQLPFTSYILPNRVVSLSKKIVKPTPAKLKREIIHQVLERFKNQF